MEGMFIDDLVLVAKGRFQAIVDDARLFGATEASGSPTSRRRCGGGNATSTTSSCSAMRKPPSI